MDDLTGQLIAAGVPIWIIAILTLIFVLAQLFPRVLGPVSEAIYRWAESRRQAAIGREDADIAEMRRQIEHLSRTDRAKQRRLEAFERHAWLLHRWMQAAIPHVPADFPPPPAAWPPIEPESPNTD